MVPPACPPLADAASPAPVFKPELPHARPMKPAKRVVTTAVGFLRNLSVHWRSLYSLMIRTMDHDTFLGVNRMDPANACSLPALHVTARHDLQWPA